MTEESNVIAQVEDFLIRFHNGDSVITEEAQKLKLVESEKKLFSPRKEIGTLADELGKAISRYQREKDISPRLRFESAVDLLDLMERARTHRVIEDKGLANRIKVLDLENNQLKEQLSNLKQLNTQLAEENKRLHKLFPNNQSENTEYGDVEER